MIQRVGYLIHMIVALDIAKSTGICVLDDKNLTAWRIVDDNNQPHFQLQAIIDTFDENLSIVVIEDFTVFNMVNPKTATKQIKRAGYIEYSLAALAYNYSIQMLRCNTVRKAMGVTGQASLAKRYVRNTMRELTNIKWADDETDAILMALYTAGHRTIDAILQYKVQTKKIQHIR